MTTFRTITAAEARSIRDDAESLPFRSINTLGTSVVNEWVIQTARHPERHNIEAWYAAAADAANDAAPGESIILEMRGQMTDSGRPETLRLTDDLFDWVVAE